MSFRRYDVQAESAQSRWQSRRSSLPPSPPAAGSVPAASAAAPESNPGTAGSSPKLGNAILYEPKRRPSLGGVSPHRRASSSSSVAVTLPSTTAPLNPVMQAIRLQKKYPQVTQEEMFALIEKFNAIDTDTPGRVPKTSVINALQNSGEASYDRARETLKDVSVDASGKVELEDWVELNVKLKQQAAPVLPTKAGKVLVKGSNANVSHTINEDEREQFTSHINGVLEGDEHIGNRLPIPTNNMQIFDECRDGLLLCKLINDSVPETIDIRVLNMPTAKKPLNNFQMTENNNIVITSAKAIGCSVVNIGPTDIAEGREHLILGLIWQVIRRGLLKHVDIKIHPELYRLCEEGETIDDLLKLTPDQILIRWFNYHLKAAGWHRRVANFSKDVSDGENYTVLLNQLKPDECSRAPLQTTDRLKRAEQVLQNAERIGCRKYLTPPALSGVAILEAFDKVAPGSVVWRRVSKPRVVPGSPEAATFSGGEGEEEEETGVTPNMPQLSRFKCVENTNYAVELAKANGMHVVGIQGADIVDGKKTLVLGLVWQLMRLNIAKTLTALSGNNKPISDTEILKWANGKVATKPGAKAIRSFKDPYISTGIWFLDLLDAIKPGIVDYSLVSKNPDDYESKRQNAKLAISIARKMNALIFLVPEDIVDIRSKLILTFVGSLMSLRT
ncbi:hypothetical protein FRC15_007394 [Serendipita sp. 397]|nr:hypothetical protein FRC15_007394 [Serendipita sp. 397]